VSRKLGSFIAIIALCILSLIACKNKVNDAAIVSDIQARLLQNHGLNDYYVHVESRGGAVVLSGSAPSATAKQAIEILSSTTGHPTSFADKMTVAQAPVMASAANNATNEATVPTKPPHPAIAKTESKSRVGMAKAATPTVTLKASPSLITPGRSAIISWTSQHATSLDIEPGVGRVNSQGSQTVSPQESTMYTVTATGPTGQATATAQVNVWKPVSNTQQKPTIPSPSVPSAHLIAAPASITEGQSTALSWTTENANHVTIQPGVGSVSARGSVTVAPKTSTTYILDVSGLGGSAIARATVSVLPAGPSQGTIVWEGEVHGTSPVSIEGNHASIGTVVSGGLPGFPCTVRLENSKRAILQTSPAQWNGWKLIVLQVQGNGNVTVRLSWSLSR
jgi:BON domain